MAFASFTSPIWQAYFDDHAFEEALGGFEWRYPYLLDLRVLEFMLSAPPVPWGWKKRLVREAMRGRLPAEVLARKKTPLTCYPEVATMRALGLPALPERQQSQPLCRPEFSAAAGRFRPRSGLVAGRLCARPLAGPKRPMNRQNQRFMCICPAKKLLLGLARAS